jgi:predicted dehydrogenase
MNRFIGRRELVRGAAAGALALAPAARGAFAARSPNDKVVVAVMGTNSRGAALARGFARVPGVDVAFICDVDERAIAKGGKAVVEGGGREPKGVKDFRRVLEDKSVDALVIAAPDHWHAPAAILACQAGKHVYVEKPSSHNPREGEWLVAAARKHKRLVQMGNQRRSWPKIVEAMEALRAGVIGRVYYARSTYANSREPIGKGKPAPVPAWLDYELWQGPAPRRPFKDNVVHYNWHWFWTWGTGEAGNNAVHTMDLCRWGLGVDYPTRVTSSGGRYHFKGDDWETPDTQVITLEFPGGKTMTWEGLSCTSRGVKDSGVGTTFHGEGGAMVLGGSNGYTIVDRKGQEVKKVAPKPEEEKIDTVGPAASLDSSHFANFVEAIRAGKPLASEIEEGHKSTLLSLLGNIAQRTGRTLRCDPKNGHILGDAQAMALWGREYHKGWLPSV